jgi:2-polyprenyl-3-methyl-5-hydroxy-6-metoxy-1,4-benzoquinol methylase
MSSVRELSSILIHPVSGKPLHLSAQEDLLTEPDSGDRFVIKDGIPQLLPPKDEVEQKTFDYAAHYQQDAIDYDYFNPPEGKTEAEERNRLHQFILERIPSGKGWVLDAGCGGGWLANSLLSSGRNIISADISDINPRKALDLLPASNHFALVADANYLPVVSGGLDCIVASEIMEHVPQPAQFAKSLYRALKPGGRLIITTPYNEFIRYSLCIHCNHNTPHNAHLHSFTEKSLPSFVPAGAKAEALVFGSKILSGFRLLPLLKWMPFGLFKLLDKVLVAVSGKRASRLMVLITKP